MFTIANFSFGGAPAPHNKKCVTYEVMRRLPDKCINPCTTHKKCYIVVSKTENSNKDLTEIYLKKVILPGKGVSYKVTCEHRVGIIWYDFKAHSFPPVK